MFISNGTSSATMLVHRRVSVWEGYLVGEKGRRHWNSIIMPDETTALSLYTSLDDTRIDSITSGHIDTRSSDLPKTLAHNDDGPDLHSRTC